MHCDALTTEGVVQVTRENLVAGGCLLQCFAAFVKEGGYSRFCALADDFDALCARAGYRKVTRACEIKEDAVNAFFATRKQLPGTDTCTTVFYPDHYETCIAGACTQWQYSRVLALAESKDYFVFILGRNHAQAYDKRKLAGGSADVFRRFIEEKTCKTVQNIGG